MTGYYLTRITSVSFAIFTFYLAFFLPESIKHNGRLFLSKYNESETTNKKNLLRFKRSDSPERDGIAPL